MDDQRPELSPGSRRASKRIPGGSGSAGASHLPWAVLVAALGWGCVRSSDGARPELVHTFGSPEAAARAFLDALERDDAEDLKRLGLSEQEFAEVVWPELPSSRPDRNLPLDYAWRDLHQKSINSLGRTVDRFGGKRFELEEVMFRGETTEYESYRVHRETWLVVRDVELDRRGRVQLFGSMIERDGRYKLFSFVTD